MGQDKEATKLKISEPVTSMKQNLFLSSGAGLGGHKAENIRACHIYETKNICLVGQDKEATRLKISESVTSMKQQMKRGSKQSCNT